MATKTWPHTVPVLTGRDICRGNFTSDTGSQHCLRGWVMDVFQNREGEKLAIKAIRDAMPSTHKKDGIMSFNDDQSVPKSKIAAVWNRAMRELGYTEMV